MFSDKWHHRFMEVAHLVASWSKDPNTHSGAVVVGPDREIRATGYNGPVRGVDDNKPSRHERPVKYEFYEHAERNCVYNACLTGTSLKGCVIYITLFPCTDCARAIIQTGIKTVVTYTINEETTAPIWHDKFKYTTEMFEEAGVELILFPAKK